MKLHLDNNANTNIITGYGEDHVLINKVRHEGNLLVTAGEVVGGWASGGFDALSADDFEAVRALGVEIVLIGTGRRQRGPGPGRRRPPAAARIGFEARDRAAACRTYTTPVGEGRSVAAARLFDPPR